MQLNDQAASAVEYRPSPQEGLLGALDDEPEGDEPQAVAEGAQGAEEEPEGTPEGQEDEEGQEGTGEEPNVSQKFRVKVKDEAGEDVDEDLTLEELAAGYMRNKRFTVGMQHQAAQEKQRQEHFFQAVNQTVEQGRNQIRALQQMVVAAAAPELANVNWQQVAAENPSLYVQLQAKHQQLNAVLGQLAERDRALQQEQQTVTQRQRDQAMRQSLEHLSREIKGFNLEKDAPKLKDAGTKYGFTAAELDSVVDGRFIHLLHDAMQWRQLQTQKPGALKKVAEAPKVIKPQAPQQRKPNQAAADRLAKYGRPSDLAAFL
jgi:hypothetical protein